MKLYIGVTDNDWFRFLRSLSGVEEVNFWQPGGKTIFKALQPGGLFLFKLHYPENFIAGGGFLVHSTRLPYTLAWEAFGQMNGTRTEEEMRRRIEKYRRAPVDLKPPDRLHPSEKITLGRRGAQPFRLRRLTRNPEREKPHIRPSMGITAL